MKAASFIVAFAICLGLVAVTLQSSLRAAPQATKAEKTMTLTAAAKAHSTNIAGPSGITAPVKICSGINAPNWRDTITVPDSWTKAACQGFAIAIGTTAYQLGCANPTSFSFGDVGGGLPLDNRCNW